MMPNIQTKRVLIVDDDPDVTLVLSTSLTEMDREYIVEVAHSGAEALAKIQQLPYTLLITDYHMPEMNGLELAQRVRQISPETQVILMTGHDTDRLRQAAGAIHLDGYLDKPFTLEQIRQIVRRAMEHTNKSGKADPYHVNKRSIDQNVPEQLKSLQANTGARCALLLNSAGYAVHVVGQIRNLDVTGVSALVAANFLAAAELAHLLSQNRSIFKSSYHEGDDYNIYAYKVNEDLLLAVIFGSESKPGVVWFYTKQAALALASLMPEQPPKITFTDHLNTLLDAEFDKLLSNQEETV